MNGHFSRNVAWITGSSLVENLTGIFVFVLVARIIGAEAFGIVMMAFAFVFIGEVLVRDTVTEAIIARDTIEDGRLEGTFAVLMMLSLGIVALLILFSPAIAALYGQPEVASLLVVASPSILFLGAGGVSSAILRRNLDFRTVAIRDALAVVAGGAVCIAMAVGGFGAWSLIAQRLVQLSVSAVISVVAAGWLPKRFPTRADLLLVRGLGPNTIILRISSLVIAQTPTIALGLTAGPVAVGLYSFAFRLVELLTTFVSFPLKGVAQSSFAELRRHTGDTARFLLDVSQIAALIAFTAFAGLAVVAIPGVLLSVGPDWDGAGKILPWLCLMGAVNALVAIHEAYLLAYGKISRFLIAAGIEVAVGIVLVGLAAPFGLLAVSVAATVRAVVAFPIRSNVALATEAIGWKRYLAKLVAPLLISVGMALVVLVWQRLIGVTMGVTFLFLSSILVGGLTFFALMPVAMPGSITKALRMIRREA
ncbi:hypothetical protein FGK63_04715 [Ruegeria sediminis]|uniref:Polysaccharide biosynthesis protein n=1 Tax=Ruegeria sediminis TaxID=2583820 RepID=A0ABY2X0T0_9RHOB|nr:oligosaccharide flippase family protein [Ruegeria sediminis]TMV08443.1 hypothetical protein FGK63_04715 [Ruegeria sediminis]